jgi:hypothetical protein
VLRGEGQYVNQLVVNGDSIVAIGARDSSVAQGPVWVSWSGSLADLED